MFCSSPRHTVSHFSRFALLLLGLSSLAVTLETKTALAQSTGLEAYNAYVSGQKALGLTVDNGAINYDGTTDTLTITDAGLGFRGLIKNIPIEEFSADSSEPKLDPPRKSDLNYDLLLQSGTMTIVGLNEDKNVFTAKEWSYSDDTNFSFSAELKGENRLKIEGRMTGAAAENYSFTMPDLPAEDPGRQASRWLPFFKTALLASYDEVRVASTALTLEAYSNEGGEEILAVSGTMQLDSYKMADANNGQIGLYEIGKITQSLLMRDEDTGQMLSQTTTQGKTVYEDMNAKALVALFDPDVSETGEERVVVRSGSMIDYSNTQSLGNGSTLKMAVDRSSLRDFTLNKRENDVLGLMDSLLSGQSPAPEEFIVSLFQLYRSFGVADARMSGITVEITDPNETNTTNIEIKEVAAADVNSDGIGEMMIVGVNAPNLPDGAAFSMEWGAIGDIEFAEFAPMEAMIATLVENPDYGESNPLDVVRAFLPRSFGFEMEGLKIVNPDSGLVHVGRSEMNVSTTVPPIPTSYYSKNDGVTIPAAAVEDKETKAFLEALGLSEIIWSDETRLYWDEATKELRLDRLKVEISGIGIAEASASFANVPKELFDDPMGQGQMALIVAQFVEAKIRFIDDGATENGLAHVAGEQNIPVSVFREALAEQAAEMTSALRNTAFTDMVRTAVSDFLKNPGEITLTMAPANPVPVAQIAGSMAAPQTLPDLLNIQVKAN